MLNNSSVVPSHLAISEVLEYLPPRRMMPSSTSQLEWYHLLCIKVWLLVHPAEVSWSQLVLVSVPPAPPQTVLLFIV